MSQGLNKLKKAKIVHLTSVHSPFDPRIFHKECITLAKAGYDVVLVASHERDEMSAGVRIRGVPKVDNRWQRASYTVHHVYQTALAESAQIYHFHDPELIPVGMMLKLHGKRVIYDVHEDLPRQIVSKAWIPRRLRGMTGKVAAALEAIGARLFDGIIAATPTIAARFPPDKTVVVRNFPDIGGLACIEPRLYTGRPNLIAYVGGLETLRGIKEMAKAIAIVPEMHSARLVLAGTFSPLELESEISQMPGWARIDFLGWQPHEVIGEILSKARIGMNILYPVPNYYFQPYSTKMFEYMAFGIPIIVSHFPPWKAFLEEIGCALFVDPLDPVAVAEAISWLLEHPERAREMGEHGRELVLTRYNWLYESQNLLGFYEKKVAMS